MGMPNLRAAIAGAIAGPALVLFGLQAIQADEAVQGEDSVVAVVDGHEIRDSDVRMMYEQLPRKLQSYPISVLYPRILERMIDRTLMVKAAEGDSLDKDEAVLKQVAFERDRVLQEEYLARILEPKLVEEKLREAYEARKENLTPEEVRARHILVSSEETAREVIKELDEGADFVALAKERSTGPSGPKGGDLDYFTYDQMVPPFSEAAFGLAVGDYTKDPVQTRFGWHVIKVEDRRKGETPSFEEARPDLRTDIVETTIRDLLAGLRSDAEIEIKEPPKSASSAEDDPEASDDASEEESSAPARD